VLKAHQQSFTYAGSIIRRCIYFLYANQNAYYWVKYAFYNLYAM